MTTLPPEVKAALLKALRIARWGDYERPDGTWGYGLANKDEIVTALQPEIERLEMNARLAEQMNTTADTNGNVWYRTSIEPHKVITQLQRIDQLLTHPKQQEEKQ